jgi:hypothetical protein
MKRNYLAEAIELASFASRWPDNNFNNPASMACRLILIASIFASFRKMMSASTLRPLAVWKCFEGRACGVAE